MRLSKIFSAVLQSDNFIPSNLKKLCNVSAEGWQQGSVFLKSKPIF